MKDHYRLGALLGAVLLAISACAPPASAPTPVAGPATPPAPTVVVARATEPATVAPAPPTEPATQPPAAALSEAGLKNGRYRLPGVGEFQLQDARYQQKLGEGASQVNSAGLQSAAMGDLDGDGDADGAVILWWNGGGSGTFVYLAAVANRPGGAQQAAAQQLGDRVQVRSLAIQNGRIRLELTSHGPGDPLCCPSREETRTYALEGDVLKLVP